MTMASRTVEVTFADLPKLSRTLDALKELVLALREVPGDVLPPRAMAALDKLGIEFDLGPFPQ